jgi:hypothetical protein
LDSADWGTLQGLPRSRVHAACLEIKGQPFYGWLGEQEQGCSPFLTGFSSGFSRERREGKQFQLKRMAVEFES